MDPEIKALPVGEAELLQQGDDLVIAAIGSLVHPALEAAQELAADGISVAVLNARFVKPLDISRLIPLARHCGAVLTVEEHSGMAGFGGAVLEALGESGTVVPTHSLAAPDAVIEHGSSVENIGLRPADIVAAARELVRRKSAAAASESRKAEIPEE